MNKANERLDAWIQDETKEKQNIKEIGELDSACSGQNFMVAFGLSEVNLQVIIVVTIRAISLKKVGSGKHKKVKQSRYTPWRRLGGEEV
jgi:hypothetical protein